MAQTWDSKLLRHQRAADARLTASLNELGQEVGRIVLRAGSATNDDGQRTIPNRRAVREALRAAIWREALRPYFIGAGDEALEGPEPRSPFTELLVADVRGAVAIRAEEQTAIINKAARRFRTVRDWLTGERGPEPSQEQGGGRQISYDPLHLWVDPNGYRLSDRVWNTSREVRRRIDRLMDYHIPHGTAAVDLAELVEAYLTPEAMHQRTRTPYGREGSYAARRLARTEITAAAGRATVTANLANPFVDGTDWRLSASHPEIDICDELATLGMSGERRREPYPNDAVPAYPAHPHELCTLKPHVVEAPAAVAQILEEQIEAREPQALRLRGAFNTEWLTEALLQGFFLERVLAIAAGVA